MARQTPLDIRNKPIHKHLTNKRPEPTHIRKKAVNPHGGGAKALSNQAIKKPGLKAGLFYCLRDGAFS